MRYQEAGGSKAAPFKHAPSRLQGTSLLLNHRMASKPKSAPPLNAPSGTAIEHLTEIVGAENAIADPQRQHAYLHEWRGRYIGTTPLVVRPATTDQVSRILQLANRERFGVVPQSGNTGLVGGQIPSSQGPEVVLSLSRMTRVRDIAPGKQHMTVEAGMTLEAVQEKAKEHGRLFPLAMASQGSCQIGGNLATNAGGLNVLAYGAARDLAYGLEVVLANGEIWNGLHALKKDNTGYDLNNLFIGSEGTLGVITAATLKLFPRPVDQATALLGLDTPEHIAAMFEHMLKTHGQNLTAFEFIPDIALTFVTNHIPNTHSPFQNPHPWYVLVELSSHEAEHSPSNAIEKSLARAIENNVVNDAVVATSLKQSQEIWTLRELISEAQKHGGGSIKHDVSVPIESIPKFLETAGAVVERLCPGARPVPFGHFGDGNIHYNISQPASMDKSKFLDMWNPMNRAIHDVVTKFGGSISAEHGIGQMKRDELRRHKSPAQLNAMRAIKSALDPNGILNPGKLL